MPPSKIACIIPTYNGKHELLRLLDSLQRQTAIFDIFIVDSSSNDGTVEAARSRCNNVLSIASSQFNHGGTRQFMVERNPGYDVYVFLTQDAYLEDPQAVERIVAPFVDATVGAVCGRQLPHFDANTLAKHARAFNYPESTRLKGLADVSELGIKVAFISNSFAAYRGQALLDVGGFPDHVILAEDMYVAAKMLLEGWKIAYAGNACCRHSHNYTIAEEFCRYFDLGVFHAREPWIRKHFGGAGGEGLRYVTSELKFLGLSHLHLWPNAVLRNACKLVAYRMGLRESLLSKEQKKRLSMHARYWDGPFAERT